MSLRKKIFIMVAAFLILATLACTDRGVIDDGTVTPKPTIDCTPYRMMNVICPRGGW